MKVLHEIWRSFQGDKDTQTYQAQEVLTLQFWTLMGADTNHFQDLVATPPPHI